MPGAHRLALLTPLRHRDFALMWAGLLMTNSGTFMQQFVLGWLVVQIAIAEGHPGRGSLYLGIVAGARAVPGIVFGVVAGAVADRSDRRRLILRNQFWNLLVISALAGLSAAGRLTLPAIIVGTIALAVTSSFDAAVRSSVITRLIPREILPSGIGIHLIGSNLAMVFGPLVGGVLIGVIGVSGLLVLNALLCIPIFGALLAMRTEMSAARTAAVRTPLAGSIREGFAYVWGDPVFRPLFVLLLLVALLGRPYQQLLPAFAHEKLHAGALQLSWLLAAAGIGSLLGSLLTSIVGSGRRLGTAVVAAAGAFGLLGLLFALQTQILPALVLMTAVGVGHFLHAGLHVTTYQARSPNHLIGRVIGASQMIPISVMPLGALILGTLGSTIGIGLALQIGCFALVLVAGVVLAVSPALRTHERAVAGAADVRSPA